MSQRNPLNQRYQGEGPGGKTRRSASSAKPRTEAASSVYIRTKPTTASEKRAAAKAREKEAARKAEERAKRAAAREAAKAEAEKSPDAPSEAEAKQDSQTSKPGRIIRRRSVKAANAVSTASAANAAGDANDDKADLDTSLSATAGAASAAASAAAAKHSKGAATEPAKKKGFLATLIEPAPGMPSSAEYKKWRRIYWILMAIGIVTVVITFATNYVLKQAGSLWVIGIAYAAIIGAFFVEFRKVRPIIKEYQAKNSRGAKSPKQLKHEKEAAEQAAAIEAARKAEKEAKRRSRRKSSSNETAGEEQES
ncbi:MAG: hypothetical protein LBR39_01885 [Coriobacteriales bacterium]|jgi:hypothetical protein|nr:hypothetical protein [Coriobacteriales bacterium]